MDSRELGRLMIRAVLRELDASVGRRVQLHRRLAGLNVRQLAQRAGVREEKVIAIEEGRHRAGPFNLLRIGKALNTPVAHFFPVQDR